MADARRQFHFVGICGTAMGSVAVAMKQRGHLVTGSDAHVYPPMSTFLRDQGIEIAPGFAAENIPADADQVIIGNAIGRGNEEVEAVLERKLLYASLPEMIKAEFLRGGSNYVVAGTHGKTTTASLLAWAMLDGGLDPSFMIGGLPKNLGLGARFTESPFTVLEGDEYDTAFFDKRPKFLHYLPEVVTINNVEFDHADIYGSLDEIKFSFRCLLKLVPRNGMAFINGDDANCLEVAAGAPAPVTRVGLGENCDRRIVEVAYSAAGSAFTVAGERYELPLAGEFNVRNAGMAVVAARHAGLSAEAVCASLAKFQGIARRQEVRGFVRGVRVIDDFGHHPTAIAQALRALRRQYPAGKIWAIFEPRTNTSQRNIFQRELGQALAEADGSILSPIAAPEKFEPEDRLDPEAVAHAVRAAGRESFSEPDTDAIIARLKPLVQDGDTIVVLSNGGFDGIHDRLLREL